MVAILVDDEALNLFPDTVIAYEINSTFFNTTAIPGTYSFPISIPITPKNRRLLQFFDMMEANNAPNSFACKLIVEGLLLANGTLKIRLENDKYVGNILAQSAAYADVIAGLKLTDLDLGGNRVIANPSHDLLNFNTYAGTIAAQTYPAVDFNFAMIYNPGSYSQLPNGENDWNFINHYTNFGSGFHETRVFTVFPYLVYVLKKALSQFGYVVDGTFVNDPEIKKAIIYNNYAIYNSTDDTIINLKNHVPDTLIGDFINAAKNTFCLGFSFNPFKKSVDIFPLKDIANEPDYIDLTHLAEPNYFLDKNDITGFDFKFNYDNDDVLSGTPPDQLQPYVIKASVNTEATLTGLEVENDVRLVRDTQQYYYCYKNAFSVLNWAFLCYSEILKSTTTDVSGFTTLADVADLTALHALGGIKENDLRYVTKLNQYWIVKADIAATLYWEYFCDNIAGFKVAPASLGISPSLAPIPMMSLEDNHTTYSVAAYPTYRSYLLPKVDQLVSSLAINGSINPFSLRLLFHRGMQPDSAGFNYPLASSHVYNYAGTKVGNYALSWGTPEGLYNTWWKPWANLINGQKVVQRNIAVDMNFFINLDLKKKIRILGVNYFITRISVKFPLRIAPTFYLVKAS